MKNSICNAVCKTRYLALLVVLIFTCGNVWGESVTITLTDSWNHTGSSGGSGGQTDIVKSGITVSTANGYKNGTTDVRVYSGRELSVSSTVGNITKIELTSTASGTSNYGPTKIGLKSGQDGTYNYSGKVSTWTFATGTTGRSSVIFTTSAQYRFTQIKVYYAAATVSKTSITGLDYVYGSGPSAAQSFTVSATNVTGNLTVTAPTNFEVCKTSGGTYTSSVTLTPSSGSVSSTTIYVRLAAGKSVGTYGSASTYVTVTGGGVLTKNISVQGTVSGGSVPTLTANPTSLNWGSVDKGTSLSTKTFSISGSNLTSGSLTITASTGWSVSPTSQSVSGTLSPTTVTVTPPSTTTAGTKNGTITISGGGLASDVVVNLSLTVLETYTCTWHAGSGIQHTQTAVSGTALTDPGTPDASTYCPGGKEFVGWTATPIEGEGEEPADLFTSVSGLTMPSADKDYYAVFATNSGGGSSSGSKTLVSNTSSTYYAAGYIIGSGNATTATWTADAFTMTQNKNTGNNKIVLTYAEIRAYQDHSLVFTPSSGTTITSIVVTANSDAYATALGGSSISNCTKTVSGSTVTVNPTDGTSAITLVQAAQSRLNSITVNYTTSGGTSYTDYATSCNGPTITVSTTEIDFGDKKAGPSHSLSYTETFTVSGENLTDDIELEISGGGDANLFSVDQESLKQTAGTVATTTITVTWTPSAAFNQTYIHINSDGATEKIIHLFGTGKWEVTWKNDGEVYQHTLVASGTKPTFPDNPTSCDGESTTFYGWTTAEWSGKIDDVSAKTIHKSNGTMSNVSNNNTIYYAVFAKRTGSVDDYTDNLTRATTDRPESTTYGDWSGVSASNTGHSDAVYAGNSAGDHNSIQLRSNNSNSGIVTTTSGGKAKHVTVSWESHTANGRTIDIYGKNTAYTDATQLYNNDTRGTLIGSIVYGTSTELTITDDYEYIGIRSHGDALYLTSVTIDWQDGDYTYSKYMTNCCTPYDITLNGSGNVSGGTFSASESSSCAGITITLSTNICDGYTVGAWDVYKTGESGTKVTVTNNQFTMPAYGVTVALTTTIKTDHFIDKLHKTSGYTGEGHAVSGCDQDVPSLSDASTPDPVDETCQGTHYKFIGWVESTCFNSNGTVNTSAPGYEVIQSCTGCWDAKGKNYWAVWAKEQ